MESEKNARLGVRSSAEQFKYEQWLANHFPNIDTLENKKRRVQLNEYIFNKLEKLKFAILLVREQKHKDLEKEQKYFEDKQASINSEKAYLQAARNYNQIAHPMQKLSGIQMAGLYKIQNIFKSYIDFLNKKIAEIQSAIDRNQQKLQNIEMAIDNSLPILGKLWSDCFKHAASLHKDKVVTLRFDEQTIEIKLAPLSEKIAELSNKLMSGEIPAHEVKSAQQEMIHQHLQEQCGNQFSNASIDEQNEMVATFETEIWKDAATHDSFGMLKEQIITVSNHELQRAECLVEHDELVSKKEAHAEIKAQYHMKLQDDIAFSRSGEAPESVFDLLKEQSDRAEKIMAAEIPVVEQGEVQRPRMR